jgi:hypothetical protein
MHQLLRRGLFSFSSIQQILKGYGIINANIVRNLRFFLIYLAFQSFMKADLDTPLEILTPAKI